MVAPNLGYASTAEAYPERRLANTLRTVKNIFPGEYINIQHKNTEPSKRPAFPFPPKG